MRHITLQNAHVSLQQSLGGKLCFLPIVFALPRQRDTITRSRHTLN